MPKYKQRKEKREYAERMNPAKPWKSLRRSTSDTVNTHFSFWGILLLSFFLSLIKGEQDVEYRNPLYEAVIILRLCKIKKEESHTAHSFGEVRQLILVLRSSHALILSKYRYISPSQKHIISYEFSNIFSFAAQHSVFLNSKRMSYTQTASHHYWESLSLVCLVTFVTPLSPSFNDLFFSHISRSKCLSPPLLSIWLH